MSMWEVEIYNLHMLLVDWWYCCGNFHIEGFVYQFHFESKRLCFWCQGDFGNGNDNIANNCDKQISMKEVIDVRVWCVHDRIWGISKLMGIV